MAKLFVSHFIKVCSTSKYEHSFDSFENKTLKSYIRSFVDMCVSEGYDFRYNGTVSEFVYSDGITDSKLLISEL